MKISRKNVLILGACFLVVGLPSTTLKAMQDSRRLRQENRQAHRIALHQAKGQHKLYAATRKTFNSNGELLLSLAASNKMLAIVCITLLLSQPTVAFYHCVRCDNADFRGPDFGKVSDQASETQPGSPLAHWNEQIFMMNDFAQNNALGPAVIKCLSDKACPNREPLIQAIKKRCPGMLSKEKPSN